MPYARAHAERHLIDRVGWLRAAVLGANDGLVSTASLIVGVAASAAAPNEVLVAGAAGLVAGAMSMAAGGQAERERCAEKPDAELKPGEWRDREADGLADRERVEDRYASAREGRGRARNSSLPKREIMDGLVEIAAGIADLAHGRQDATTLHNVRARVVIIV